MIYELRFGDGKLTCGSCGKIMDGGVLIEWKRGFQKEILCQKCYGICLRNEKNIQVVATIEPHKENKLKALKEFVLSRRDDIENDIEDFGMLKPVLNYFMEASC